MATFLMGLPTGGQYDVNTAFAYRSYLFGYFVQDDWRVTPEPHHQRRPPHRA